MRRSSRRSSYNQSGIRFVLDGIARNFRLLGSQRKVEEVDVECCNFFGMLSRRVQDSE